jgi:hypothetical protein
MSIVVKEPWILSPSGLYDFTGCKSCFWVDHHIEGPGGMPLPLNMAMDSILKNRYDSYRKKGAFPPEVKELLKKGIKPFLDLVTLDPWRKSSKALAVANEKDGYILRGKIDDVFVEADGRLIAADYKSSGYAPKPDKQKYYRYQLAAYAYMFEKAGHKVSDRAFLLHYYVTDTKSPKIEVAFSGVVDEVSLRGINIPKMLRDIVKFLESPYPGLDPECETCTFYKDVNRLHLKSRSHQV